MKRFSLSKRATYILPFLLIIWLLCFLTEAFQTQFAIVSFATDSSDRLYVGFERTIEVYDNGNLVAEIDTSDFRTYHFTITTDDRILIASATHSYTMDLKGNLLSSQKEPAGNTYCQLKQNSDEFVSQSGKKYTLKWKHIWPQILESENVTVYQVPMVAVAVRIIKNFCWCLLSVVIDWEIWKMIERDAH